MVWPWAETPPSLTSHARHSPACETPSFPGCRQTAADPPSAAARWQTRRARESSSLLPKGLHADLQTESHEAILVAIEGRHGKVLHRGWVAGGGPLADTEVAELTAAG